MNWPPTAEKPLIAGLPVGIVGLDEKAGFDGLAHALKKPVVLVSSNKDDVPFDVQHVRVIYYEKDDPFWGQKLIEKVAENILSALQNPKDAILFR